MQEIYVREADVRSPGGRHGEFQGLLVQTAHFNVVGDRRADFLDRVLHQAEDLHQIQSSKAWHS